MLDDSELLRRYAQQRDELAFAELVTRHVNVVYSAALRQTGGDATLAQDAAQIVFTDLARKAQPVGESLQDGKPLVGWLYTSTRFAASHLRRTEQRRQSREMLAHAMNEAIEPASTEPGPVWADLRPLLDEAMSELAATDRDAVLLRYFEGKDLRAVGAALGLSEDAARKRISRAVDILREFLASRGIKTTGAALSAALSLHAVQIAPGGLAASLTRASLVGTAALATTAISRPALKAPVMTNVKLVILTTAGILLIGALAYQANRKRNENAAGLMNTGANIPAAQAQLSRGTDPFPLAAPASDPAIVAAGPASDPRSATSEHIRVPKSFLGQLAIQAITMTNTETREFHLTDEFIKTFRLTSAEVDRLSSSLAEALHQYHPHRVA